MPTLRNVLELLPRADLLRLADRFRVELAERRGKRPIVDALASSPEVKPEALLLTLDRVQLRELCRSLGLDSSGREKTGLVARLLSTAPAIYEVQTGDASHPTAVAEARDSTVTWGTIFEFLIKARESCRANPEGAPAPLTFSILVLLKRLNDTFEERAAGLLAEGEPQALAYGDADAHEFFVPEEARWSKLLGTSGVPVERRLNRMCSALERANPRLKGVLTSIDFEAERSFGRSGPDLIRQLSSLPLRDSALAEPDALGKAHMAFLEQTAYPNEKKAPAYFTPPDVVRLLVELLEPEEGLRICDPACGTGSTLIACARYVTERGGYARKLRLEGQEILPATWALARINLILHGLSEAGIELGDTLREPRLVTEGHLRLYDRIIANPPISPRWWGHQLAESDPYHRFQYGLPPRDLGDFAFLQHMVAALKPNGLLATVAPHGVLFRGKIEEKIRAAMLRDDLFEAVIGLPGRLLLGTTLPIAILVLNKSKQEHRRNKILFIDASREAEKKRSRNSLRPEDVARIARAFHRFENVPGYARVVGLDEVAANEYSLALHRYVEASPAEVQTEQPEQMWRRIELKNYRSIAEASIELAPFAVIVGSNGSGKSNFADALVFARDVATDAATAVERRGGIGGLRRWQPDTEADLSVDIRASTSRDGLDTDYLRHQFTIRGKGENAWAFRHETIELFARGEPVLRIERTADGVEITPKKQAELIGRIARLSETASAMVFARQLALLARDKALRSVTRIRLNPDAMRLPQAATEQTHLEESGSNIAVAFRSLDPARQERVLLAMQRIVPGLMRISVEPFDRFLLMRFEQSQGAGQVAKFSASEMSEGALRALGILVAAQQMTQDELLIIEEPEVAIHVGAAHLLFQVLKDASSRGAVLITTHSADLLDASREEAIFVCSYRDGVTQIGPLASAQRDLVRQNLFSVAELMRSEPLRIEGEEPGTVQL